MSRYHRALRFALSHQANAYGFTLVVWSSGALAVWQLGKPDPGEVFAFLGGALVALSLIVALVFGIRQPFEDPQPPRLPFSAMHLASAPAAAAAGWALAVATSGTVGFFLASFAASGVYQLLLGLEVATALVPGHGRRRQ